MISNFSENVKKYRKAKGWSLEQLAEAANISVGTAKNAENDKKGVTLDTARKVSDALGVPLSILEGQEVEQELKLSAEESKTLKNLLQAIISASQI